MFMFVIQEHVPFPQICSVVWDMFATHNLHPSICEYCEIIDPRSHLEPRATDLGGLFICKFDESRNNVWMVLDKET